jgi:hypothetical protein
MLTGNVVRCIVSDNGSAPEPIRRGRGLRIIGELGGSLGGRVQTCCTAEGYSFLLNFPLTEAERRVAGATHVFVAEEDAPRLAVGGVKVGRPRTITGGKL